MPTLFVPAEVTPGETRCAIVPETISKLAAQGLNITVQSGAGTLSSYDDAAFEAAGAKIIKTAKDGYAKADLIFKVRRHISMKPL